MPQVTMIVIFGGATIVLIVYGFYQFLARLKTLFAERLQTYADFEEESPVTAEEDLERLSPVSQFFHLVLGRGYIQRLEDRLAGADLPMRASEYILLHLVLAGVAFLFGLYGLGHVHSAIFLAFLGFATPPLFLRVYQRRRLDKFVRQLADALMLLTTALRSGYSFLKGLDMVAKEMDDPISKELNRTLREVNLGATIDEALLNLGRRIDSQDMDMVISAYLVQKDVGGNLTEIMQKVAETIRERLRIQGDIKVMTAQGRLSGLIVGLLPFGVALFLLLNSPGYFAVMLEPPNVNLAGFEVAQGVLWLIGAVCWQLLGVYLIYKIVSIKV